MDRYIRTKDGKIYDTEKYAYTWSTTDKIGLGISATESLSIPKSLIEKPADNIEELCDEAIVIEQWRKKPFVLQVGGNGTPLSCARALYLPRGCIIYGAIWTNEGLIYVAKMNQEGELEPL